MPAERDDTRGSALNRPTERGFASGIEVKSDGTTPGVDAVRLDELLTEDPQTPVHRLISARIHALDDELHWLLCGARRGGRTRLRVVERREDDR